MSSAIKVPVLPTPALYVGIMVRQKPNLNLFYEPAVNDDGSVWSLSFIAKHFTKLN